MGVAKAPLCNKIQTLTLLKSQKREVSETSQVVINSGPRVWRLPWSASPHKPIRECHPVHDHVPDTPALCEPVAVVERVVNAAIEAGEGRFLRGLLKGGERPGGLGGHQAMICEQGVGEGDHAEHGREDHGGGTRLGGMP
jgi:hypothetical protein